MTAGRGSLPATLAVLGIVLLVGLGVWQLERRSWKLQLIDRVGQRVHASPVGAPGPADWPRVSVAGDEYRHVELAGEYIQSGQVLVQALTRLGSGFWVMTPLRTMDGSIVLINRGFIPAGVRNRPDSFVAPTGRVAVTGLLRISEPWGRWPRRNDLAGHRWYSRDVTAIADSVKLTQVAPYFVDADATASAAARSGEYPVAGLTVISFPNNHLLYAITWFGLALAGVSTLLVGSRQPALHASA